jgi:predicted DCC family thiol-disulfide oxidoreductase YuxK
MAAKAAMGGNPALTILYDGACPLCLREVHFLQGRDRERHCLTFVDIDDPAYDPGRHAGISYREAMGRIHAIDAQGAVLRDVAVFRRAYELIGLGWLYAPTGWPLVGPLAEALYRLWARLRLRFTGRPALEELCRRREGGRPPAAAAEAESRCRI